MSDTKRVVRVDEAGAKLLTKDAALAALTTLQSEFPTVLTDEDADLRLAKSLSDLQGKLPNEEAIARKLIAMARLPGLAETVIARCLDVIPSPAPMALATEFAAFIMPTTPWPAALAFNRLSEIGTHEAGRLAGTALLHMPRIGRLSPRNADFLAGLAEAIGQKSMARETAIRLVDELATARRYVGDSAPLPSPFARLARDVALPLIADLETIPCQFPGGYWTQVAHRETAWTLYHTLLLLSRCDPEGENLSLLERLATIDDPFILEAALELRIHQGLPPAADLVRKACSFPKTRISLYDALSAKGMVDLMPVADRHWLRLAEGRIAEYLLAEGDTLFDQFQLIGQKNRTDGKKKFVAVAFRATSSFIADAKPLIGMLGKILPETEFPLAEACAHMRSDDSEKSILEGLAKL